MDVLSCPNCGESKSVQIIEIERGKYFCKTCGALFNIEQPLTKEEIALNALIAQANVSFENADLVKAQEAFESALSLSSAMSRQLVYYIKWNLFLIKYRIFPISTGGKTYYTSVSSGVRRQDMLSDAVFRELVQTKEYCDAAGAVLDCADEKNTYYSKEGGSDCDIFICFKWKDRLDIDTPDVVCARQIYRFYTQKGYRVFFAPESLKNMPANNFDDHIKAALISAKVLFLPASKSEYVRAEFVRNEWVRFLALKNLYNDRVFVPIALDGMNPADFPFCTQGFMPQVLRAASLDLDVVEKSLVKGGYLKKSQTYQKEDYRQTSNQQREQPDLASSAKQFADDLAVTVKTYAVKAVDEIKRSFDNSAIARSARNENASKAARADKKGKDTAVGAKEEIFYDEKPKKDKNSKELTRRAKVLSAIAAILVIAVLIGLCFLNLPKSNATKNEIVSMQTLECVQAIDCLVDSCK